MVHIKRNLYAIVASTGMLCISLQACSSPEVTGPASAVKAANNSIENKPEQVRAADLALDVAGVKTITNLKVETVTTDAIEASLKGELTLDTFKDFKQPLKAKLTVTNPQTHAIALRYHSGMMADLWLVSQEGKRLWAWSDDMMFTQALRDTQISAGQEISAVFEIPAKVLAGIPIEGLRLEAHFAGKALESDMATMAPVILLLKME